jgi:hypothetical protein
MNKLRSFGEFWPYYLAQHARTGTRTLHLAGTAVALVCFAALAVTQNPMWFIAAVVGAYGCAWLGHGLIERNTPATFSYPLWSLRADVLMFWLALTGQLEDEFKRTGVSLL